MGVFDDTIRILDQWGVSDVLLPFFLIFVIVFAILQRSHVFGKSAKVSKRFDVIVALVMGAAVVFTHVLSPGSRFNVVPVINNALPQVSLWIIAIVMVLLILGVLGVNTFTAKGPYGGVFLIAAIALVAWIFIGSFGRYYDLPRWLDSTTITVVITLLVFALVIWFITRDDTPKEKPSFSENINKHFGGGDS